MSQRIRVLLIGSASHLANDPQRDEKWTRIREAVRLICQKFAEAGCSVLTMADRQDVLAEAVVEGFKTAYAQAGASTRGLGRVELHFPANAPDTLRQLELRNEWVTGKSYPITVDPDAINLKALESCDAVVLIGGSVGTKSVGLAASLMSKVIVPVGCFGGAAEAVWSYGSSHRREFFYDLDDDLVDELYSTWKGESDANNVINVTLRLRAAMIRSKTPPGLIYGVVLVMLAAMVTWVACLTGPSIVQSQISGVAAGARPAATPSTETLPGAWAIPLLIATATLTGIIGACVQTLRLMRRGKTTTPRSLLVDTSLGFIVGVFSAVVYLVAEIGVKGALDPVKGSSDYLRVALMISLIAFFAGAYLDAALARFDGLRESVLRGKIPDESPKGGE
ncbi:MAG: hypothetical protein ACK55O_15140 [Phycisphaerales bacterium]|jgi:hypothetical protein|nr:hypothetical protein [Phycisphaeraceae bacterium]